MKSRTGAKSFGGAGRAMGERGEAGVGVKGWYQNFCGVSVVALGFLLRTECTSSYG